MSKDLGCHTTEEMFHPLPPESPKTCHYPGVAFHILRHLVPLTFSETVPYSWCHIEPSTSALQPSVWLPEKSPSTEHKASPVKEQTESFKVRDPVRRSIPSSNRKTGLTPQVRSHSSLPSVPSVHTPPGLSVQPFGPEHLPTVYTEELPSCYSTLVEAIPGPLLRCPAIQMLIGGCCQSLNQAPSLFNTLVHESQ